MYALPYFFEVSSRLNRKGTKRSIAWYMERVSTFVDQWEHATTQLWDVLGEFNEEDFRGYLQLYLSTTRTRLIRASDPEAMPYMDLQHRDPSQSIAGAWQHAVRLSDLHMSFLPLYFWKLRPYTMVLHITG